MSENGLLDFIVEVGEAIFGSSRDRHSRREASHQEYLRQQRRNAEHQAYLERKAQREANRAAYFERVSNNVARFRAQYGNMLDDLRRQGLDRYVQAEYDEISRKLKRIDQLISRDEIEAARDLSLEVGQSIHGLFPRARREKSRIERGERELARAEKERQENEIRQRARQDFIDQMKRNLESDKDSNPAAIQEGIRKLDDLKDRADTLSETDLQDQLVKESDKVDGEIADETVRRTVIKSIYQSLRKSGFIVSAPQMNGDVVLVRARKPAGQQAEFNVSLDGTMKYKFDNYEGQKCRKDIDEVTAMLEECYGVKLSKRKVLWSNPDRIKKGSKDAPNGGGRQAHN
jgi:hypothetical protein